MADTSASRQPATSRSAERVPAPPQPAGSLPWVLTLAVLALTLALVRRSVGALLAQVQLTSGNSYGGMESVGSGLSIDFVARTQALLEVWREAAAGSAKTGTLIARTALVYTVLDMMFLVAYASLIVLVWRWLCALPASRARRAEAGASRLRQWAWWPRWWVLPLALAVVDAVENLVRLVIVERTVGGHPVSGRLIWASWVPTTLKLLLGAICLLLLVVLLLDSGIPGAWWHSTGWALWRLRVAVLATVLYAAVLLADPTGQAVDLARRWLDGGGSSVAGVLALAAAGLLGFATWLTARRVVLADQNGAAAGAVRWRLVLPAVAVVTALAAWASGWQELGAAAVVAISIWLLGFLWNARPMTGQIVRRTTMDDAADKRAEDARAPREERLRAARHVARTLAVAPPAILLILTAVAYAPVPLVVSLSDGTAGRWLPASLVAVVAAAGAPLAALVGWVVLRAWDGGLDRTPTGLEKKYLVGSAVLGAAVAGTFLGAFTGSSPVTAFVVVPVYLAAVMLLLGEAQRWSETHTAPPGLLAIGLTRVPVSALLVLTFVLASYRFTDGSAHAVHREQALPAGLVGADGLRSGVNLDAAFGQWVAGNCAGAAAAGAPGRKVPLILVAAPGGGLRAAYWTGSTLSDLFGAVRGTPVPGCAAAPSDRIFAVGGASGGSLGALSYVAGLDPGAHGPRADRWYDDQLARPDFLTDPLAWLLTADAMRVYLGYGGEDRARRLEKRWQSHITGLDGDFLAGTWGQGGHRPLMMVTGTHVETGCRLNVGGLRLTDAAQRRDEGSCATLRGGAAQADAPVTADLLDYLCGPEKGSDPGTLSYATAALLSARFPYVSPSGELYRCARTPPGAAGPVDATRTAVVDGGYADNTGIGMLLALWPRLEPLVAAHNAVPGNATVVPVLLEVDNHYAQVAAPTEPGRTVEMLVPPSTKSRPDKLDDRAMEGQAAGTFSGAVPGTAGPCDIAGSAGRFARIGPRTSPGLPAPLAWTLSRLATEDLTAQRKIAVREPAAAALSVWAGGTVTCR